MLLRSVVVASSVALGAATLTVVASAPAQAASVDVTIIGTNDFHGRIKADGASAGAAAIATYVKQVRAANANTVFAAAGDLIGASTFESYIAHDKPTIDALNQAGLDVSSVGNHEFDQGFSDLTTRVMAPYNSTTTPYGGADWQSLASNVRNNAGNAQPIPPTWTQDFGSIKVGF